VYPCNSAAKALLPGVGKYGAFDPMAPRNYAYAIQGFIPDRDKIYKRILFSEISRTFLGSTYNLLLLLLLFNCKWVDTL
jgi:hypothetical protein